MNKQDNDKLALATSTRRFLCYEHEGAKALLELSNAIQRAKEHGGLSEGDIVEIMNEVMATPPGYKDPQDLASVISTKLMKFQHSAEREIVNVEIVSKKHSASKYPYWVVDVTLADENCNCPNKSQERTE